MYDAILNGIKNQNQLDKKKNLKEHLRQLQSAVKKIRIGYKNSKVKIEYSKPEIQESYLIAYFPHYTTQFKKVIKRLIKDEKYDSLPTKILSIGGGPCPEVIGYLKCLQNKIPNDRTTIHFNILDKYSHCWSYSHKIIFDYIVKKNNPEDFNLELESTTMDLAKNLKKKNLKTFFGGEEKVIVSAQNFLNEIKNKKEKNVISNFMKIFDLIPKGSYLILSDFYNYGASKEIMKKIEEKLTKKKSKVIRSIKKKNIDLESPYKDVHSIIKNNLLTNENFLKPKVNIKFCYTIIKKQ